MSPIFEMLYIIIIYVLFITALCAVGIDSLFAGFAFLLSAHFKIIQFNIKKLKFNDNKRNNSLILRDLNIIINHHVCVLKLCVHVKKSYKFIIFFQFLISSLQLCLIGYQLTLVINCY